MKDPIFSDDFEDEEDDEFSSFVDREATPSHGLLDSEFEEYRDSFQDEDEDDVLNPSEWLEQRQGKGFDELGEDDVLDAEDWVDLTPAQKQKRMSDMSNKAWKEQEKIMEDYYSEQRDDDFDEDDDDFFEDEDDDFDI